VAIAAVLAAVLIFGRRMRGSTRYSLAAVAFVASLVLPLAAFVDPVAAFTVITLPRRAYFYSSFAAS
jgi:hypothetical protein